MNGIHRTIGMIVAALTLPAAIAGAQGVFLEKGESGFGAGSSVFIHNDYIGSDFGLGFSFRGLVDLGVSVGRTRVQTGQRWYAWPGSLERDDRIVLCSATPAFESPGTPIAYPEYSGGSHVTGTTVSPGVTVHLLKQEGPALAVHAAYEHTTFKARDSWDMADGSSSRGFTFGATAYRSFGVTARLTVIPHVGFSRSSGTFRSVYPMSHDGMYTPAGTPIKMIQAGTEVVLPDYAVWIPPYPRYAPDRQVTYMRYVLGTHLTYRVTAGVAGYLSAAFVFNGDQQLFSVSTGFVIPMAGRI